MKKIYFFAKVGNLASKPYGGGEVGNRRTMAMLTELGFNVKLISRYYNYEKKNLWIYIKIISCDIWRVIVLFFTLLFGCRHNTVVHIAGFTGIYMPLEMLSVIFAKILGYNTTYEIRGGGIIGYYNNGNTLYRRMFRLTVQIADNIWSQGYENKTLIKQISRSHFFYYPNCVKGDFMPNKCPVKNKNEMRAVYFGRICPVKNVMTILQTVYLLHSQGLSIHLDIIGDGVDFPDYEKNCRQWAKDNLPNDLYTFHGKLAKQEIIPLLQVATFFLFPSEEPREGQSNSLTEAMSFGIIPIASSQDTLEIL